MKKLLKWFGIFVGALIVISVIAALLDPDTDISEPEKVETAAPVEEKEEVKEETPKDMIISYINEEMGEKTNTDKERVVSIGESMGAFEVVVNGDENLTTNLTLTSMYSDANEIFEQLQSYDDLKQDVMISIMQTFTDQYGNENEDKALMIRLNQETLDKINFENFNYENYPNLAVSHYLHPAFQK